MFDGVKIPSAKVQAVVRVGSFLRTCLLEADKHRREHARTGKTAEVSLEEIFQKAGLNIPDVQAAIRNLMGDGAVGAAANDVLSVAKAHPDLAKLAEELARLAAQGKGGASTAAAPNAAASAASGASTKEAPAPEAPAPASTATPAAASEPTRRPEPVAATRARFRPEYTSKGRLAALGAGSVEAPQTPSSAAPRDVAVATSVDEPASANHALAECNTRLSALEQAIERLVTRVETSLGDLRARVEQLEARMTPQAPPLAPAAPTAPSEARPEGPSVEPPPLLEPAAESGPERPEPNDAAAEVMPIEKATATESVPVRPVGPEDVDASSVPANAAAVEAPTAEAPRAPAPIAEESVHEDKDAEAAFALLGDGEGQP